MQSAHGKRFFHTLLLVVLLVAFCVPCSPQAIPDGKDSFRWIDSNSDPELWHQIESAFRDDLKPDAPSKDQPDDYTYRYKYLQKVGIVNSSALVIIGHRPTKELTEDNAWDEYSLIFNFNTISKEKKAIDDSHWRWQWKYSGPAALSPAHTPDLGFTYLTCTECEPDLMFDSLFYDARDSEWKLRRWDDDKSVWWAYSDGLVLDTDIYGGTDTLSYDCTYGAVPSKIHELQDFAIRCKQATELDSGQAEIEDTTAIYSDSDGSFRSRVVRDPLEIASLTRTLCAQSGDSLLCKLPVYARSQQTAALRKIFPEKTATARDLDQFRKLKRPLSMADVVYLCGRPDEMSEDTFIYHLDDGSIVVVGTQNDGGVAYVKHASREKTTTLVP